MHLTALSGYHFVHHMFDAAISVIKYLSQSIEEKANLSRQGQAMVESRLSVLESRFTSFQTKNDIEFATQQELNDWQENQSTEKFFVISGLPPAPTKLSGGSCFYGFLY